MKLATSIRRLWGLVVFALRANPFLLAFSAAVFLPAWWFLSSDTFRFDLVPTSMWGYAVPMLGFFLFAPAAMAQGPGAANPLELFFTRAIDRRLYFRSLAVTLLLLTTAPLLAQLGAALLAPDLVIRLLDEAKAARYRDVFPGSHQVGLEEFHHLLQGTFVPNGRVVVAGFELWRSLALLTLVEGTLVWMVSRRLDARWIGLFYLPSVLLPVVWQGFAEATEELALVFAVHPAALYLCVSGVMVVVHLTCERAFARLEVQ